MQLVSPDLKPGALRQAIRLRQAVFATVVCGRFFSFSSSSTLSVQKRSGLSVFRRRDLTRKTREVNGSLPTGSSFIRLYLVLGTTLSCFRFLKCAWRQTPLCQLANLHAKKSSKALTITFARRTFKCTLDEFSYRYNRRHQWCQIASRAYCCYHPLRLRPACVIPTGSEFFDVL